MARRRPALTCRVAVTATGPRDVERGVAVEEADRLQGEAGVVDGHDRPVLRAREVRQPEGVPHDDVGAVDLAVGRGPGVDAGEARVLVDEPARGVALLVRLR